MKNYEPKHGPDWWLRWKGRRDARKGAAVVDATILKMIERHNTLEFSMTQDVEDALHPIRCAAAAALTTRERSRQRVQKIPVASGGKTPRDIRADKRYDADRNNARSVGIGATDTIVDHNEKITSADVLLQEDIQRMRALTKSKVLIYVAGVRSKHLPDYDPGKMFIWCTAHELYIKEHAQLDDTVRAAAENAWNVTIVKEEENNEKA